MGRSKKVPGPCKACKHHVSIHQYIPGGDGRPADCRVPGCPCKKYKDPRDG